MTKEETKQAAEVMLAFVEGKKIKRAIKNSKHWDKWEIVKDQGYVTWDFDKYEYCIMPESKYRPFKSAVEAFNEAKKHGFWVKVDDDYRQICYINSVSVEFANEHLNTYKFDELTEFVWADDGSKCGILEE